MHLVERALEAAGHAVLNLDDRSRHLPLERLADPTHPPVSRFAATTSGAVHNLAHSMGGLLVRVYLARHRPLRLGRVVMIGTPKGGSEVADLLRGWPPFRAVFGPAGQQRVARRSRALVSALGKVEDELDVIAGDRPLAPGAASLMLPGPSDGKVTVASTQLAGMADHRVVPASHTRLISHRGTISAVLAFLGGGAFPPWGRSARRRPSAGPHAPETAEARRGPGFFARARAMLLLTHASSKV